MTNGGFIQYFYNRRDTYQADTLLALNMLDASELSEVFKAAVETYKRNIAHFQAAMVREEERMTSGGFTSLYENGALTVFTDLDRRFYEADGESLMELCGRYIRNHIDEFFDMNS